MTQRDAFLDNLYSIAQNDRRVILLSDDFGAPSLDKFRKDLSSQFINMGVAEQNMINVARGLAMAGKIVYTYAILPFYMRCYEQIRHLCLQNLNVNMIGVGAGFAYSTAGPTHHALEDIAAMRVLPNLTILNASDNTMAGAFARMTYNEPGPKYVRLDRKNINLYKDGQDFSNGFIELQKGEDLTIIATGYMVQQASIIRERLAKSGLTAGIIDLFRIKPVSGKLPNALISVLPIVTIEENLLDGGIGTIISELLTDTRMPNKLHRVGVPDQYYFNYEGREELHRLAELDADSIVKEILEWL